MNRAVNVVAIVVMLLLFVYLLNPGEVRGGALGDMVYWVSIWLLTICHVAARHHAIKTGGTTRSLMDMILQAAFLVLWGAGMLVCVLAVLTHQSGLLFNGDRKTLVAALGFSIAAILLPLGYFFSYVSLKKSGNR